MIYIVMGVSSSGKTLVGTKLAQALNLPFYDADDYHPESNIGKMKEGLPLNDKDRLPWLRNMARAMQDWEEQGGAVLACSALKKSYRSILTPDGIPVQFIYLKGSRELIAGRMKDRNGHFMPLSLLDSQFEALEKPERAITVSIDRSPEKIVGEILEQLEADSP